MEEATATGAGSGAGAGAGAGGGRASPSGWRPWRARGRRRMERSPRSQVAEESFAGLLLEVMEGEREKEKAKEKGKEKGKIDSECLE